MGTVSGLLAAALTLGLTGLVPAPSQREQDRQAPGVELLVERVQDRYRQVHDLRGRFVQRRVGRLGSVALELTGQLFAQPPGKMRWEYDNSHLFVATGTDSEMYLYFPEDNQVEVYAEGQSDTERTPILYLAGRGNLRRDFRVAPVDWGPPLASGNVQLELVPRRGERSYRRLVLEVEPRQATIARLVVFQNTGETIDYQFHDVEFDVGLPDDLFEFAIPEGASVLYIGG